MNAIRLLPEPANALFPLGDIYITKPAEQQLSATRVINALARHSRCDWGNLSSSDTYMNELALEFGGSIVSAYGKGQHRFLIFTNYEGTKTTVMLPEDFAEAFLSNTISYAEAMGVAL